MKRVLQLITGFGLLAIVMFGVAIATQQYFTHIPIAAWEWWLIAVLAVLDALVSKLQLDLLLDSFKEAIKFIWIVMKFIWSQVWRRPTKLRLGVSIAFIMVALLAGLYFLGFYKISFPRTIFPWQSITILPPSFADQTCADEQKQGIKDGIGVFLDGGDCIGISSGGAVFNLSNEKFVQNLQKAAKESSEDPLGSKAQGDWSQAHIDDQTNAEPDIYLENIRVQGEVPHPHVTLIVAVVLTGKYYYDGRDVLQGVYLQQMEHNYNCREILKYKNCVLLKVLIANIGSGGQDESDYAESVTDQMAEAIANDRTIVGVMSGSTSQGTINITSELNTELTKRNLPMIPVVAAKATYDYLPLRNYLFRVVSPDSFQAQTAADYAETNLHAKHVAILYRHGNTYSTNLEGDFQSDFPSSQIVGSKSYDPDSPKSIQNVLKDVLARNPNTDTLYCACYALDVNIILQWLSKYPKYNNLRILGGDALYELGGYTPDSAIRSQLYRLYFTAFTYPDLWDILERGKPKPPGIEDYAATYGQGVGSEIYGATRMLPNVSVAYDAMLVLATSCDQVFTADKDVTASNLDAAIFQQNIIGISGRITFGRDKTPSDPYNKIVVVIQVVNMEFKYTKFEHGTFV